MEVHHHPEPGKKSLKGYLLEGLMIFVAVTLGFFAESFREHISEHQRAKEFAATMLSDLSSDTADLGSYLKYTNYAAGNVDTLFQSLSGADPAQIASGKLYWYGLWGAAHGVFVPHDATIEQMKSSGSLRYFGKPSLNHMVAQYDQLCRRWAALQETDRGIYLEVRKARAKIFEFKYNDAANNIWIANRNSFNQGRIDSFVKSNPPLLSYDKVLFNEYVELVRSRYLRGQLTSADSLLSHASALIKELKNEYGGSE